jgi:hypothetical protein
LAGLIRRRSVTNLRELKGIDMNARFGYHDNGVAAKFIKYINSAGAVVSNSGLRPPRRTW